ncbi:hypothetical protein HPB50_004247 [Hyalomma asiaticum]|uniref:Uncharacterized protein n=1 Tax=Hyalomma asiaticum TaxID=266040 RepID=A0ACB7TED6_HYAAI|nr:hypothetical protein HPB50_004247 [Hyalomma asiaticum]
MSVRYDSGSSRDSFAVNVKAVLAAHAVDAGHDQLSQFARFSDFRARCTTTFNGISEKLHGAAMKAVSQNLERGRTVAAQQRELALRTPTARAVTDKVMRRRASAGLAGVSPAMASPKTVTGYDPVSMQIINMDTTQSENLPPSEDEVLNDMVRLWRRKQKTLALKDTGGVQQQAAACSAPALHRDAARAALKGGT